MPFGLCNAPTTFQRCMTAIFHDMVEDFMEVFMDGFSVFGNSIDQCLNNLDKMLSRCEETNLVLNWEKCHFMVNEGAENLAADHLTRLENPNIRELAEEEIKDKFLDNHLMILKAKLNDEEPWYADYVNYIDKPYAFRLCPDNVMRRCVAGCETLEILEHRHSGPTEGHHSASVTGRKVYEAGFYWPSIFKDAKDYVFDIWGLDFMGPFPDSRGNKYILVTVDYVSKWVEAQALPINDARVLVKFLKGLFARFGVPKALISDRGTHFCNPQLEKALLRYGVTHRISTAYYPQTNGQTEVTNRAIKRILERSVRYNTKDWNNTDLAETMIWSWPISVILVSVIFDWSKSVLTSTGRSLSCLSQSSPVASGALRRRVMVLAPEKPIPHGRPYRYHLNGPVHMMTARKRVGPLPTHFLAVRHSVDHSSSDHFSSDDSSRVSSSSSSLETSLDSSVDALSDSASSHSSSDHSLPTPSSGMRPSHHLCSLVLSIHRSSVAISERPSHDSSSVSPSRKRSRSPAASVPLSSPTLGTLSYARADRLPSPKRIRSPETATDLEGTNLEMNVDVVRSDGIDIDPKIHVDECIAYADAFRDASVVVEAIDREEIEMGMRGPVEIREDKVTHLVVADVIPEPAQEGAVEVTYETLGDLVQRFHDHAEEISILCVQVIESVQRDQGHRILAIGQQSADMLERIRELEQDNIRLRDMMDVASQRVARSQRRELRVQREMRQIRRFRFYDRMRIARLEACARRHLGYLIMILTMPNTRSGASRSCEGITQQIDRQMAGALGARTTVRNLEPLMRDGGGQEEVNRNEGNGNGGNGYNFGGFVPARECTYQDFLKCQPLSFNGTEGVVGLTRWFEKIEMVFYISNCPEKYQMKYASCTLLNSALTWWNSHKRTIRIEAAYAMSWAELMKLMTEVYCLRNEGNVIVVEPTKLQDAIRITNNLMDQKLKGYARSHNVARAYTAGNNEKNGYVGSLPYYNKCKLHHAGPCTVRCGNCKRVGHITRNCTTIVTPNTQRAPVRNQSGIFCYECGRPGHFRKDYPKLRNQNRGNKTENKNGNKTGNQTGCNEATAKACTIGV
ncbi:reverse transcriptase domain-containing protein [Tanacetum coccineum]